MTNAGKPVDISINSVILEKNINIRLHFDPSCETCDQDSLIKQSIILISNAINSNSLGGQVGKNLVNKLIKKNPYEIYVDCKKGCTLNEQSFFDTPNHVDGTNTIIEIGPLSVIK